MQPYDLLSEDFFEIMQHNGLQKTNEMLVNFSNKFVFDKKINSDQIWDKSMQPFWWFGLWEFFLKCCSKIEHSRYTIVAVNFPRKYLS